jgi:hypothetical protein
VLHRPTHPRSLSPSTPPSQRAAVLMKSTLAASMA